MTPRFSEASSIALSDAILDWTGYQIAVTGSVTIGPPTYFNIGACASATTTFDSSSHCGRPPSGPFGDGDWAHNNVSLSSTPAGATLDAEAHTAFGYLHALSAVEVDLPEEIHFAANSFATTQWHTFFASGIGTITISIPYTLSVNCLVDGYGDASAFAFVEARSVAAALALQRAEQSLACDGSGTFSSKGMLTLFGAMTGPEKPLSINIIARTAAIAKVPDTGSTFLLMAFSTAAIAWLRHLPYIELRAFHSALLRQFMKAEAADG